MSLRDDTPPLTARELDGIVHGLTHRAPHRPAELIQATDTRRIRDMDRDEDEQRMYWEARDRADDHTPVREEQW